MWGQMGKDGENKGEEEREMGEATLYMTSSLTTVLRGPSLTSYTTSVTADFTHLFPIKAEEDPMRSGKQRLGNAEKLRMVIDRQMAVRCWRFLETSKGLKVSGEV